MTELITLAQVQEYKGISGNLFTAKSLTPLIIEAQEFDLRPFLGDEFYIDLLEDFEASPSLVTYSDLYNGVNYTYSDRKFKCDGIAKLVVHYVWARYLMMANIHSTPEGLVQKKTEFSDPITEAARARIVSQAKSQSVVIQETIKRYLDRNRTSYPLWLGSINRRQGSIKIIPVGGNSSFGNRRIVNKFNCECDEE